MSDRSPGKTGLANSLRCFRFFADSKTSSLDLPHCTIPWSDTFALAFPCTPTMPAPKRFYRGRSSLEVSTHLLTPCALWCARSNWSLITPPRSHLRSQTDSPMLDTHKNAIDNHGYRHGVNEHGMAMKGMSSELLGAMSLISPVQ